MSRPRLVLLAVLVAAGLTLAVERLVVTDREAVEAVLSDAADAVTRGDWAAVETALADDFDAGGRDRAGFVAWAREQWRRASARGLALDVGDVRVEGDRAAARVVATITPYLLRLPGRVELERRGDRWKVVAAVADDAGLLAR